VGVGDNANAWHGRLVAGGLLLAVFGVVAGVLALLGVEADDENVYGWTAVAVATSGGTVLVVAELRDRRHRRRSPRSRTETWQPTNTGKPG
jgi:hypothetical protein